MKALSQRPMINLIRRTYFLAAAVSLFASLAVTASMLIAGRAPQSVQYWTITIAVSLFFIIAGLLLLDKGVLRSHQKIVTAQGEGEITSGGFAPTLNQSIALARLPAAVASGDTVQVEIRGKLLNAQVVRYPFVRNGKRLVA